jgi:hypothetical protein
MQEVREVLQWLSERGVSGKAMDRLMRDVPTPTAFRKPPCLTTAQANFASLKEVLNMSDAQVRLQILRTRTGSWLLRVRATALQRFVIMGRAALCTPTVVLDNVVHERACRFCAPS